MIIVDGQNGAKAWFRDEPATADQGDKLILKKGDAVFVHVKAGTADITSFGF